MHAVHGQAPGWPFWCSKLSVMCEISVVCGMNSSFHRSIQRVRCHRTSSNCGDVWLQQNMQSQTQCLTSMAASSARRTPPQVHMAGVASLLVSAV
jgi:hypothetical protein